MKRSVAWMARNHVAANLLMVFVLLTGALGVLRMKKETFPEIDLDRIRIQVPYPGASPEDVEAGVVRRIEERITGLEGIRRISSTSAEGMAAVTVELELGADMERVVDDVRGTIDRIDTFPAETEKPVIKELVRRTRVIDVVLYGEWAGIGYWVFAITSALAFIGWYGFVRLDRQVGGDGAAVRLAGRQRQLRARQHRVQAVRQRRQPGQQVQAVQRSLDRAVVHRGVEQGQIVAHRGAEELHLLRHYRDPGTQLPQPELAQVDAVHGDAARLRVVQARE